MSDIRPKRIRFWHNGVRWHARASYGGLFGYVPVGSGETPEDALSDLAQAIRDLRRDLERGDAGARLWETAFSSVVRPPGCRRPRW